MRAPLLIISAALFGASASAVTPEQEKQWRDLIRATLFISDSLPPLAPQTHGRFEPEPGVIAERDVRSAARAIRRRLPS